MVKARGKISSRMVPGIHKVRNDPQGQSQNHFASQHHQALSTPNIKGCLANLLLHRQLRLEYLTLPLTELNVSKVVNYRPCGSISCSREITASDLRQGVVKKLDSVYKVLSVKPSRFESYNYCFEKTNPDKAVNGNKMKDKETCS